MGGLHLALRRLVAQRFLALGLLVCISFTVGVVASGPIYARGAARSVVVSLLERTSPLVTALRIRAFTSQDVDLADADRTVAHALAGLPFGAAEQQLKTPPLLVDGPHGAEELTTLAAGTALFGDIHLLAGRLPTGPGEALLDVQDASNLGVFQPGQRVVARSGASLALRVVGIFQPTGRDPLISGRPGAVLYQPPCRPSLQGGTNCPKSPPLPVLLSGPGFAAATHRLGVDQNLTVEWDALLRPARVTPSGLPVIVAREQALVRRLQQVPGLGYDVSGGSGLQTLVGPARRLAAAATSAIDLVVVAVAAVALAVTIAISSLLVARQSLELSILKSRGTRRLQLLAAQALQAICAAVVALPFGLAFAVGLAAFARAAHGPSLSTAPFPISLSRSALVAGVVAAAVSVLVLLASSWRATSRSIVAERRAVGRAGGAALLAVPVDAAFLVAGGIAFFELRRRGLAPTNGAVDPLVLLAPTLLLFGGAIFAVRVFLWATRRADGLVRRIRSLPVYLATRRVARAPDLTLALVLLLLVSMGLLVTASSLRATVLTADQREAWQAIGADWSTTVLPPRQPLAAVGSLPPNTTPLYVHQVSQSSSFDLAEATVVGLDPSTYPRGGSWPVGASNAGEGDLLGRLDGVRTGIGLPGGTTALRLEVRAAGAANGLRLEAAVERPDGAIVPADPGPLRVGTAAYRAEVGSATRLLAVDVVGPATAIPSGGLRLDVLAASAQARSGARPLSFAGWRPLSWNGSWGTVGAAPGAQVAATLHPGVGSTIDGLIPPDPPLPALLPPGVGLPPGQHLLTVTVDGVNLALRPVGTLASFPGLVAGRPFVVVPVGPLLERLDRALDQPVGMNMVWAMGRASPTSALTRLGFMVQSVQRAATLESALAANPGTLAMGMEFSAAIGAIVLVVAGLGLAATLGQRRRDFEVAALRAAGVGRSKIVAAAAGEQACLVAFSIACAIGLGLGLLRLVLPFVRAGIAGSAGTAGVLLDWRAVGIAGLCTLIAAAAGVAIGARRSLRSPVTAVLRGEPE